MSVRLTIDARSFWTLCGTASRIAQRMGIHRDGAAFNFSPFEAEMRRRLWWNMMVLDFSAAELCGSELAPTVTVGDAKPPLYIDDADISPDSKELPPERTDGPSEMMFPAIRNMFIGHFRNNVVRFAKTLGLSWDTPPGDPGLEEAIKRMAVFREHMRAMVEERFLRFANTTGVPEQYYSRVRVHIQFMR